jgi:hypothetical protein
MTQCAKHWLLQLLIALDQLLNVLVTPFARGAWGRRDTEQSRLAHVGEASPLWPAVQTHDRLLVFVAFDRSL